MKLTHDTRSIVLGAIKKILIALCVTVFMVYGTFLAIIIAGALSFDSASSELKVRNALLVTSNNHQKDGFLDVRAAIQEKDIPSEEEWQRLYKFPIVPPLDQPLSNSEKQLCAMIRQYEDGRSRFYDPHFFGISLMMPARYIVDRTRGGSTALQSAVGKVLNNQFGKPSEIFNTALVWRLPEEVKCRVIISALDGSIVKNGKNYQTIKGGYALSAVIFDKPLKKLNNCELAFLSTAFRRPLHLNSPKMHLNHHVYTYAVKNNSFSDCLKFDIMAKKLSDLDEGKHPISINREHKSLPVSVGIHDYIELKKAIFEAKAQLEKQLGTNTVIEVAIKHHGDTGTIRVDSLNRKEGFGDLHTPASLIKPLVAKVAIESGEPISSERLRKLLCQSDPKATAELFDAYQKSIEKQVKAYHVIHKIELSKAITTENSRWSSDDILHFADDFVSLLQGHKKIPNAFGESCTMNVLRPIVSPRHAIFAKSGTAQSNGKTVAKLLLFAIKHEQSSPSIILIRIEGTNNEKGLCEGDSCFSNALFKPFLSATLTFSDSNNKPKNLEKSHE